VSCPCRALAAPACIPGSRALFLDRDGVINIDYAYVHKAADFEFMPGVFELCALARARGYRLVVVTNQAGIGRGYYGHPEFLALTAWLRQRFEEQGLSLEQVYYCPHHAEAGLGEYRQECASRKPNPGMLLAACHDMGLAPARSVLIGDKAGDMEAGLRAGVGRLILLGDDPIAADFPCQRAATLADACLLLPE
jgi:D-glycero-D-manno-heptose 1,7-bisphosphate phosphatase